MVDPVNLITSWLIISALYALVAIGFTMIFGVGGVLNLAHGAVVAVGAFSAYAVSVRGLGPWTGALAALVAGGLFSVGLYLLMIRNVADEPIMVMILTLVSSIIVEEFLRTFVGSQPRAVPSLANGQVSVAGATVQTNMLLMFVVSWLLIGALLVFINHTDTGKAIIATSMSAKGAAVVGIDSDRIHLYTWLIAGVLAGIAGVFLASYLTANWAMGRQPLILSFSIVILGGLGSIRGSVVGAYLIGFLEVFTVNVVNPRLSGVASLVVLVLVLLVKPEGLFGRELAE